MYISFFTKIGRAVAGDDCCSGIAIKSSYHHPRLYSLNSIIQVRWTRHAGYGWRSRDELISDVLLWTPTYGRAKAGWPAQTYIQHLCEDTGCSPEDLPEAMNEWEKWRERVRDIHAGGTTWWWYIYHVTLLDWISLTLTHHSSLSSITSGWSSRLHLCVCWR